MDIALGCDCGQVQGMLRDVSPTRVSRVICMCDDCQMFAHFLERGDELLDANGGTDVVQTIPAKLSIETGQEQLRCMRLTPKGLVRWFTDCCNTPLGNTLASPKVPFVGMPAAFIAPSVTEEQRRRSVGPVQLKLNGKFGIGELPADCHDTWPKTLMFGFARRVVSALIRGGASPTPFFGSDGRRIHEPDVLTQQRLCELRRRVGPSPFKN